MVWKSPPPLRARNRGVDPTRLLSINGQKAMPPTNPTAPRRMQCKVQIAPYGKQ